ncbi:DUF5719 family protein [Streptomyces sp. URMC 123]|uniref:DUF5719 family protein n=1 Tax=Streptomyces sp. URMC 123 TaxID=3423403 RepID=UPI003F1B96C9
MNRTTLSLIGAVTALAAITTTAVLTGAGDPAPVAKAVAERLPVERSTLLCPAPAASELAETTYTAFTPKGEAPTDGKQKGEVARQGEGAGANTAELRPVARAGGGAAPKPADGKGDAKDRPKPVVPLSEAGKPAVGTTSDAAAPALMGTADGALAPGWTVQQTTVVSAGIGRGALGASCTAPDTEFWFPGVSTGKERQDYIHLTNPDDAAAVVDLELYGTKGAIKVTGGEGITVPAHASVPVLLSTLTAEPVADAALHVVVRDGRVGAAVQAVDAKLGSDWLQAAADPSGSAVLPGIPADATSVHLIAFATGGNDAELAVRLAGPGGRLAPAGHDTLQIKSGMAVATDLGDLTKGEPGSLLLTPADGARADAPFVAALRVVRGKGDKQETAFIPAVGRIDQRATAADNREKGGTLSLVAPGEATTVRVTASAGSEGGTPVAKEYTVKGGTTLAVQPPVPSGGKGGHALTVEHLSGGPVHASRMLELPKDGIPMFTVQTLPDDRGTVAVPAAEQDLSLLTE